MINLKARVRSGISGSDRRHFHLQEQTWCRPRLHISCECFYEPLIRRSASWSHHLHDCHRRMSKRSSLRYWVLTTIDNLLFDRLCSVLHESYDNSPIHPTTRFKWRLMSGSLSMQLKSAEYSYTHSFLTRYIIMIFIRFYLLPPLPPWNDTIWRFIWVISRHWACVSKLNK